MMGIPNNEMSKPITRLLCMNVPGVLVIPEALKLITVHINHTPMDDVDLTENQIMHIISTL
jgi:hypothetical protein